MPNNVSNYPWLPKIMLIPSEIKIKKCVAVAERKMEIVCRNIKNKIVKKRGFNIFSKILGLPQGVTALPFERKANNAITVTDDCNGCGQCVVLCPMKNLKLENSKILHDKNCTICYRCINACPQKAITVLFRERVIVQYRGISQKTFEK